MQNIKELLDAIQIVSKYNPNAAFYVEHDEFFKSEINCIVINCDNIKFSKEDSDNLIELGWDFVSVIGSSVIRKECSFKE